ncbi:universal stress protein family protein [Stappia aggregata IAM 12614]|uniref:Universal stress protein n=1 Tax=Roseibium aggregatum (strain ATCC 25650 / DSM 13394 / JCM 20685 / NBRC 16684 / NCIMB 2208 / IAM 12614 / B1) TaxID=384765 RepID=A0NM61_ROSAI|nr:universal stress protein [Roseibium aggregatum]EAV46156.1 universal stress protein family protein [Stappia aggregata IAM 12614] [Roseibium aggregatum IAM 12614]
MTKSILCAIDIQQDNDTMVLQTADKLARLDDAQLDVITVVPSAGINLVASYFDENFQGQMVVETQKKLVEKVSSILGAERNSQIRHLVATGSIYEEILEVAKKIGADLIVIGAHQPHLSEFLLGPNAARVVRHSKCSVYVVRD